MFQGFSEHTHDFLWGIRFNNHREWFLEHKQDYLDHVYNPLKELGAALMEELEDFFQEEGLQLKVSRIYRDVRRVKYGGLYKDHMWLVIRFPGEEWLARPAFYFELSPEGYEYGLGYYCATPTQMEIYRRRILRDPKPLEALAKRLEGQELFHLEGEEYKRSKGDCSPALKSWFNRKNITLCTFRAPDERLTQKELVEDVAAGFRWLIPYYHYLKELALEPPIHE